MTLRAVAFYWPSGSMLGLSGAVLCLLADSGCTARRLDSEREAHMAEVPMGHAQECMYVDVEIRGHTQVSISIVLRFIF